MRLHEKQILIKKLPADADVPLLFHLFEKVKENLAPGEIPIRFVITDSSTDEYVCELGIFSGGDNLSIDSIFDFNQVHTKDNSTFNVLHLIPTGIGCHIGGHVDGGSTARLLGGVCDHLITHPNVVNAADINEMPNNTLYVEGSVITRFIMGTVGLQPVNMNRVLVISDKHQEEPLNNALINSVNAARTSYGFNCPEITMIDPPINMYASLSDSGRAVGTVENLTPFVESLLETRHRYDAVAVATVIGVDDEVRKTYYQSDAADDDKVNPWGGVEAMLTHTLSSILNVPTAHSPMEYSQEVTAWDPGITDPRISAEAVSVAYLQCILKGLQRSPKIVQPSDQSGILTARNISAMVIPYGVVGLPTLAAIKQGIPVIAIRENVNIMNNVLEDLDWAEGQLIVVDNYLEAVGVLSAMKSGIDYRSVRRPIKTVQVNIRTNV